MPATHSVAAPKGTQIPQLSPTPAGTTPAPTVPVQLQPHAAAAPVAPAAAAPSSGGDTAMTIAGVAVGTVVATAALWALTEIAVTGTWNRIKKRF